MIAEDEQAERSDDTEDSADSMVCVYMFSLFLFLFAFFGILLLLFFLCCCFTLLSSYLFFIVSVLSGFVYGVVRRDDAIRFR